MSTKELINFTAQLLKEYSLQTGYGVSSIIPIAKPLMFEIAADKGLKLTISDLNDLESSLEALDSNPKIVSLTGRKRNVALRREIDYVELKSQVYDLLENTMSRFMSDSQEDLLLRAKSQSWVNKFKDTSNGSFAEFLKAKLRG